MITHFKNEEGFIIAYCEWRLVGPSGYETPNAEFIWVNDCWVHPSLRMMEVINQIIDEIMNICPQATAGYFQRKDVSDKVKIYKRNNFERRRKTYDSLMLRRN